MTIRHNYNPNFIHHQKSKILPLLREVVFGVEDGMVSTLGAITGIATATGNYFIVVLSGVVVISVESISMGVGSYLSNKSERDVDLRKIIEEKQELKDFPEEEKQELQDIYIEDGWPKKLAETMAETASQDKKLFLKEMIVHELAVDTTGKHNPVTNGITMFFSYVVGGSIPLLPYFVLPISYALPISIVITLSGLFFVGVGTTKFTKRKWWKAGLEMFGLASAAALVGYAVGQLVEYFIR
ncbi:hypothetical protein HOF40_01225 [Candidatus Parcubacteria bacterium]|nr:hypothetical protein [Candidatus Parcubacteria bacterium]MBT3948688.1 hypothetical protein [Candidatus Parcubacteria bacterium]